MTTHWCHDVSVPGPVDPDGCCADQPEQYDGCDCTELCSMGPTCPGGALAGLPGSGCWRTTPTAPQIAAGLRAEQDAEAAERLAKGLRGERG